jgi:CRISPR-associated endoribonuclease Cas6
MRLKIICVTDKPAFFPYNYNSTMQAMIYHFIQNSSQEFSEFLHKKGFIKDNKHFKLFTFSKLFFLDGRQSKSGFSDVTKIEFLFSTPIQKSYEHLVLGIFANQEYTYYYKKNDFFKILISHVESVPEPEIYLFITYFCINKNRYQWKIDSALSGLHASNRKRTIYS